MCIIRDLMSSGDGPVNVLEFAALARARPAASARCSKTASATTGPLWFQLYVYKDREMTRDLAARAESHGYRALVLTVDTPRLGRRERDLRNGCTLPPGVATRNLAGTPNVSAISRSLVSVRGR